MVIEENKELRATNSLMEKEHGDKINGLSILHEERLAEVKEENSLKVISLEENFTKVENLLRLEEKKLFELSHTLGRCKDDLKVSTGIVQKNLDGFSVKEKDYSLKVEKLSSELITINSLYNQLLGKVDVLEGLNK